MEPPAQGIHAVSVDDIIFAEHLSPGAPADENFNPSVKDEIARRQMLDFRSGKELACAKCRQLSRIDGLYRCYYCGVWYCRSCAKEHFESAEK